MFKANRSHLHVPTTRSAWLVKTVGVAALALGLNFTVKAQDTQCVGDTTAKQVFKISIVPQLPQGELFARWSPVLEKIGRAGGWCFDLYLQKSIPDFEAELFSGRLDFAFANPYHSIMAHRAADYEPLIADQRPLSGILVVRQDAPIQKLSDLEGQTLAFPAPNAFAASLVTRALLSQSKIHIQTKYVKTHSNVYRSVLLGDSVAGGAVNNTLQREPSELKNQLRVLYETPGYTAHPVVVHPRVLPEVRERFQQIFIELAAQADNQVAFNNIQIPNPRRVARADYEALTRLGLEQFVVKAK